VCQCVVSVGCAEQGPSPQIWCPACRCSGARAPRGPAQSAAPECRLRFHWEWRRGRSRGGVRCAGVKKPKGVNKVRPPGRLKCVRERPWPASEALGVLILVRERSRGYRRGPLALRHRHWLRRAGRQSLSLCRRTAAMLRFGRRVELLSRLPGGCPRALLAPALEYGN
jgi:hypothetical protein